MMNKNYLESDRQSQIRAGIAVLFMAAVILIAVSMGGRREYIGPGMMCCAMTYLALGYHPVGDTGYRLGYAVWVFVICAFMVSIGTDVFMGTGFYVPGDGIGMEIIRFWLNYGIVIVFLMLCCVITGRFRSGLTLGLHLLFALGLVNAIVYQLKGGVLLPADVYAAGTAAEVAGGYTYSLTANEYIGIMYWIAAVFSARSIPESVFNKSKAEKKKKLRMRLLAAVVSVALVTGFFKLDVEKFYYSWWPEDNGYLYTVMINLKMINVSVPKGYKADEVEGIIEQGKGDSILPADYDADKAIAQAFPEYYQKYGAKPVIIGIMNESFSDLSKVGEIATDSSVFSNIDALSENTIKGNLYTEVYGGGTSDTEYTFLTGNSTILFADNARAYELYVKDGNSSLAGSLKAQGYSTEAIHGDNPQNWNRVNTYPKLGFDNFISRDAFAGSEIRRDNFYSDRATYQKIIDKYKLDQNPFFAFDVTIQNHGGYDQSYNNLDRVTITNPSGFSKADQYMSLVKASDEDFGELIRYFQDQDRPVIIVMFGDHQPKLDEGFYEALTGSSSGDWTPEQQQNQQITPFVIWANYDIPEETYDQMSVNYLGTLFTEASGTTVTPYQQYLAWLYRKFPVIDKKGVVDAQGNYESYQSLEGEQAQEITDYRYVLYNNIFDQKNRDASLYSVQN
ncbi:MAG: LTA synthase family protein [Eubacteriaceae bacterium]|jgi:phosphoglycerol transferase MdoB-like AlkP superfamily enzyme